MSPGREAEYVCECCGAPLDADDVYEVEESDGEQVAEPVILCCECAG